MADAHDYWTVPVEFSKCTVVVIGGGPSLKGVDMKATRVVPCIVANNAFEIAPWANYLFFHDRRWWEWNAEKLQRAQFKGRLITSTEAKIPGWGKKVFRLKKQNQMPLPLDSKSVCGADSGYMAACLAYLLGAKKIVLLGFDMRFKDGQSHWHPDHKVPSREMNYVQRFLPNYKPFYEALKERGVELVLGTPSAINCIPYQPYPEVLSGKT